MREKKNLLSLILLALIVAWQVNAIFHFLLIPHAIDEYGHVVHVHPESSHSSDEHQQPHDHDHNHDGHNNECRILALLVSPRTDVSDSSALFTQFNIIETTTFVPSTETDALHESDLFELSPSNSPPSFV